MREFIILRAKAVDPKSARALDAIAARFEGEFEDLVRWRGVRILARADERDFGALVLPSNRGIVFGALFRRAAGEPETRIREVTMAEADGWAESGGAKLVENAWGPYGAALVEHRHDNLHVIASPSGAMPLFRGWIGDVAAIFSEPAMFARAGGGIRPDPTEVEAFLRYPNRYVAETALEGVDRIMPGERLTLPREGERFDMIWRPPNPEFKQFGNELNASEALRTSIMNTCQALCSLRPQIVHRLSGGLDSSLVLGALRKAAPEAELIAATDFGAGAAEGDERQFARMAAAYAGARLVEAEMRGADVDYARMLEMPLAAAPSSALSSWSKTRASVSEAGAPLALVTSGQGGDHVFYRGRSSASAVDTFRDGLGAGAALREALHAARRQRRSLWSDAGDIIAQCGGRPFDLVMAFQREGEIRASARRTAQEHAAHPWLKDYRRMHPGAVHRILLMLDAQTYFGPSRHRAEFAFAPPLLFEPVLEAALKIPSYVMCAGGRDRGLARKAFEGFAPAINLNRQSKGQTTRFVSAGIAANRDFLCDLFRGGELARYDLIDADALVERIWRSARADGSPPTGLSPAICAEMWLRGVDRVRRVPETL